MLFRFIIPDFKQCSRKVFYSFTIIIISKYIYQSLDVCKPLLGHMLDSAVFALLISSKFNSSSPKISDFVSYNVH